MAVVYIPDEIIARVIATGRDKQAFAKEAIEEKLEREITGKVKQ